MKHIKNNPPELCERRIDTGGIWFTYCHNKAKYERLSTDPKAKPMRLCGVHGNQAKRRGFVVKLIGE